MKQKVIFICLTTLLLGITHGYALNNSKRVNHLLEAEIAVADNLSFISLHSEKQNSHKKEVTYEAQKFPAAATGMAAVVLHGRGAMFYRVQKHPKRWANAAHFYITRSMWNNDKQQSKKGEIGPFADGPSYFEYARWAWAAPTSDYKRSLSSRTICGSVIILLNTEISEAAQRPQMFLFESKLRNHVPINTL